MGNGYHKINVGQTGSGKTYQAVREGARSQGPCLFFNPKGERAIPDGYIAIDRFTDDKLIKRLIHKGMNLSFQASRFNWEMAIAELGWLVEQFVRYDQESTFIVDEVNKYAYEGLHVSPALLLAEEGREYGINAIFTTQYPGRVNKTIFVNCRYERLFNFNRYSALYYQRLRYPVADFISDINSNGEYSYVLLDNGEKVGVYKE